MKKNTKDTDTELEDDEELRIRAMASGPKIVAGREMRPITGLTVSWMQRNKFWTDRDTMWKAAAFMLLHSEPMSKLRGIVNNSQAFNDAVDIFIERNMGGKTLQEIEAQSAPYIAEMESAFTEFSASQTSSEGTESGN